MEIVVEMVMEKIKCKLILTLILLCFSLSGSPVNAATSLRAIVGVPPYAYLAERIGGEYLQVKVLIDQGQDPHLFEPTPKQIISLGEARILFSAGLEFEQRLIAKIKDNFPSLEVVDLSKGEVDAGGPTHHEHDHHTDAFDPHIWLSPSKLKEQAHEMAEVLGRLAPSHKSEFQNNLAALLDDLHKVRQRIAEQLHPFAGRNFFVFHPAFEHFGEEFALEQLAVESSGKVPSPREVAHLISKAKEDNVKIIFVQPQFDQASAAVIASAIGGVVLPMDPLAHNILDNFVEMADKLERAFK